MEPNLMEGPVPPKAENTAVGLHPTEGAFAGEQILFCPQNKNTNIFCSKIKTEYEYDYIQFRNKDRI